MKTSTLLLSVMVLLALLPGCNTDAEGDKAAVTEKVAVTEKEAAVAPEPTFEIIRGEYLFAHEVRAMRPCGETEDVWVIDRTGILAKHHQALAEGRTGDIRIRMVALGRSGPAPADGFGADYPSAVTIDQVVYAAKEGFGCDFDLTRFTYRASGTEPFWHVALVSGQMKLTFPGTPEEVWNDVVRKDSGDTIFFLASRDGVPAVLTILPGPGFDDMSGAYYHHRARFQWGEYDLKGAALQGFPEDGS